MVRSEVSKEYAAGFAAGVATVITGHPFDTIKVRLQAYNTKSQVREYKNAFQCAGLILRNEGVKGFYRGASSSVVGMAFESSLLFGMYSQIKQFLQGGSQSNKPKLEVIIPSAASGGAIISLILGPTELIKCRMQVQEANPKYDRYTYTGPLDCAYKTLKNEGMTGLFRGSLATMLRESIGNAVFFTTYEFSRYYMQMKLSYASSDHSYQSRLLTDVGIGILSGGVAGMAFWTAVLPLDVTKTLIQTTTNASHSRNPLWTLRSIYQRVGLRGCYAGLGPTLVRAFPANAAAIVTWELTAKLLGVRRS